MPAKKIVALGGGSLYYPHALADLVTQKDLAGSEIVLYDIDAEKLALMTQVGKRLAREAGTRCKIRHTLDLADACDNADFALSAIGGSGAEVTANVYGSSFHNADMRIGARYGVHQLIGDTGGPAAMMMALRSIPVYLRICRELEKRAPRCMLFNHSNPMAVLMRAIHKYSSVNAVGVCHGVQIGINQAAKILGLPAEDLQCTWIGTNHYYWFTRMLHNGRDVYPDLLKKIRTQKPPADNTLAWQLSNIYNHCIVYQQDDHIIEFYNFLTQLPNGQKDLPPHLLHAAFNHDFDESKSPARPPSAADRVAFFKKYRELINRARLPGKNFKPHHGEQVGAAIAAIATGRRTVFIANIANQGAIPNLPATAEVEVESVTDYRGVRPLFMGDAPLALQGLLAKRFAWHELVADAAVTGDRNLALQAMLTDEMAILPDKARGMLDEMLLASKKLLPQFFR